VSPNPYLDKSRFAILLALASAASGVNASAPSDVVKSSAF